MGMLVEGVWRDRDVRTDDGRFVRVETQFRNWITEDGRPGPTGEGGFKAEAGRYHLYVSLACPWAHRTLIMRKLKALETAIGVSVVHWHMAEQGWVRQAPGADGDGFYGHAYLYQLYAQAQPGYTGRASVPVLWDRETRTIVNNELAEIIRMLNGAFAKVGARGPDYYPAPLRAEIDAVNERVYEHVNNGVYKAGFARPQEAYEEAVTKLFQTLDELEDHLSRQRYLPGERITEADIRLFTTLVRFDPVYVGHFKCNLGGGRLSEPLAVRARTLSAAGGRRDGRLPPHQASLLRQPRNGEPDPDRAARPDVDWKEPHRRGPAPRSVSAPPAPEPTSGVAGLAREQRQVDPDLRHRTLPFASSSTPNTRSRSAGTSSQPLAWISASSWPGAQPA